ncbi:MAG: PTS sugar transporter subunit IIA, partial [Clostridia bacterium]|nr:PTS sugar transporter subunit IIA [Clostridia bacterium]
RIKELRPDITVTNTSVDNIPADCDIAVVQEMLIDRAQKSAPQAEIVSIGNFLADPALDVLFEKITSDPVSAVTESMAMEAAAEEKADAPAEPKPSVMHASGILLQQPPVTKETAIRLAGKLLVDEGCVEPPYVEAMLDREKVFTTYMGMGIAIPHGTSEAKAQVKKTGITLVQFPEGVDFGDEKANLVFGIAGIGDEHLDMIQKIVQALDDPAELEKMKTTDDVDWILQKLS